MNLHDQSITQLKIIVDILLISVFLGCLSAWMTDQPFFSMKQFKLAELHYRQNEVVHLRRYVIVLQQLENSMHESPEIFLKKLDRLFGNRLDAEQQFEADKQRNRLKLMRAKEDLNLALTNLDWIELIEKQIVHPHAKISEHSVFP